VPGASQLYLHVTQNEACSKLPLWQHTRHTSHIPPPSNKHTHPPPTTPPTTPHRQHTQTESKAGAGATDKITYAQQLGGHSNVVLLQGLVDAADVVMEAERQEVNEMVYEEALRCGRVKGIAVPLPPLDLRAGAPCRVYVRMESSADAARLKQMMDGRMFDDRKVRGALGGWGL